MQMHRDYSLLNSRHVYSTEHVYGHDDGRAGQRKSVHAGWCHWPVQLRLDLTCDGRTNGQIRCGRVSVGHVIWAVYMWK